MRECSGAGSKALVPGSRRRRLSHLAHLHACMRRMYTRAHACGWRVRVCDGETRWVHALFMLHGAPWTTVERGATLLYSLHPAHLLPRNASTVLRPTSGRARDPPGATPGVEIWMWIKWMDRCMDR